LIATACARGKLDGYCENHHIEPKSLGGSDFIENLVFVTPKEHFVLHLLLPKMCVDVIHRRKMYHALHYISGGRMSEMRYTSRLHDFFRRKYARFLKEAHHNKGKKIHSPESRAKMSAIRTGRKQYTNGSVNIIISGEPPEGFWHGKVLSDALMLVLTENNPTKRPEVKAKLSAAWAANTERKEWLVARNKKGSRAVVANGEFFPSISECAKYFGMDGGSVRHRCNSSKYITWYYRDKENIGGNQNFEGRTSKA